MMAETEHNKIRLERIDVTSFGQLKNLTLMPSDGLNILTCPNEAGKSTLAAFLKFVFYGFRGSRKQELTENERTHYMPWDGAPASGGVTVVNPQGKFRIERTVNGQKETVSMFDFFTAKPVFAGKVPGEVFFGLTEEAFVKILYLGQLAQPRNGDADLAEQVQNLLFSADERVNTQRALDRLSDARKALMNRQKRGIIPDLEEKKAEYDQQLAHSQEINRNLVNVVASLKEKKEKLEGNEKYLSELNEEKANIERWNARKELEKLAEMRVHERQAGEKYEKALSEFEGNRPPDTPYVNELINDNASLSLMEKQLGELKSEIATEEKELATMKEESPFFHVSAEETSSLLAKRKSLTFLLLAGAVLFVGGAAALWIARGLSWMVYALFGCAVVCAVGAAVFAVLRSKTASSLGYTDTAALCDALKMFPVNRKRAEAQETRVNALQLKYNENVDAYRTLKTSVDERIGQYVSAGEGADRAGTIQKMLDLSVEIGSLKAEYISLSMQLKKACENVDIQDLQKRATGASEPARDEESVTREIAFYTSADASLRQQEMELEKQKSVLETQAPDPSVVFGKREAVASRITEYNRKLKSLDLALQTLENAGDYIRSTVSPKLSELASAHFTTATGGKYKKISMTTEFSMSFEADGGAKDVDYLSAGTRDAAYLSLRLALLELLYDTMRPFILLDDAFTHLDDDRVAYMLRVMRDASAKEQIFLFTCHSRETRILNEFGYSYQTLSLESDT